MDDGSLFRRTSKARYGLSPHGKGLPRSLRVRYDWYMQDFRRLRVWQKARLLVRVTYGLTACYPRAERFGLTAQSRSAATSIAANIAEGCGRFGRREYARFASMALGSAFELESHLELARDLGFAQVGEAETALALCSDIRRMLVTLIRRLGAE